MMRFLQILCIPNKDIIQLEVISPPLMMYYKFSLEMKINNSNPFSKILIKNARQGSLYFLSDIRLSLWKSLKLLNAA